VRHANVYGIDMPTRTELIASFRSEEQIADEIGADALIYQRLEDLKAAVQSLNPAITQFETSCFDGHYVTGDVTTAYLEEIEDSRARSAAKPSRDKDDDDDGDEGQMDLNLVASQSQ